MRSDLAERTRSDASRTLLGSGSLYALATAAPILSTLLVTPVVTRSIGPSEYGVVGVGITFYQAALIVLSLGLPAAITRHAIIEKSGPRGASGLVALGIFAAALLATALIITRGVWGGAIVDSTHVDTLIWPVTSAFGLSVLILSQSFLRALDRVVTFVVVGCASAIAGPLTGVLLVAYGRQDAANYLAGLATGHVVVGVCAALYVVALWRPHILLSDCFRSLRIGLPTVPHQIASAALVSVLVVVAGHMSGLENAGRLQLALLLGTAPIVLLGTLNNAWAPMVYRADDETRPRLLSDTFRLVSLFVLLLVAGFCAFAQFAIDLVAGPEFSSPDMVQAATIAAIACPLMALYLVNIHLVFLSGKTGLLAVTTPLSTILSLGAVTLTVSAVNGEDLRAFAIGLPVFHASQVLMGTLLRRRTRFDRPSTARGMPFISLALVIGILASVFPPSLGPQVGALAASILVISVAVGVERKARTFTKELVSGGSDRGKNDA